MINVGCVVAFPCKIKSLSVPENHNECLRSKIYDPSNIKCNNVCFIGLRKNLKGQKAHVFLETMNSHGMFRIVERELSGKIEKLDVSLYDIYYFEIIAARIRSDNIMLLINTMEESFVAYINFNLESFLVPLGSKNASAAKFWKDSFMAVRKFDSNLYHAYIHYDEEVTTWHLLEENVTGIQAVKIFGDEILIFTKYKIKRYSCLKVFTPHHDEKSAINLPQIIDNVKNFNLPEKNKSCQINSNFFDGPPECYVISSKFNPLANCSNVCFIGQIYDDMVFIAANGLSGSFYWVRITQSGEIKNDLVNFGTIHEFENLHGEYDNKKVVLLGKTENRTFASIIHRSIPTTVHSVFIKDSYAATIVKAGIFSVKMGETHVMWSQILWKNVKNGMKIKYQNLMKNDGIEKLEISGKTLVIYTTDRKCSISIEEIIDPYLALPEEDSMKNNC
uniref:Uncharacterized protein n=1 Tax=Panagrolaimus sp. JU765 TaxID=591449 RepID=A0AC34RLX7_9BILA